MYRFFIFDSYGQIAGNPKGYRTHQGAERQVRLRGSKAYNQVWNNFWLKKDLDPNQTLIYRINAKG